MRLHYTSVDELSAEILQLTERIQDLERPRMVPDTVDKKTEKNCDSRVYLLLRSVTYETDRQWDSHPPLETSD